MSELSLQAGEILRIRSARGFLLVMRSSSGCEIRIVKHGFAIRIACSVLAWWLRMHRRGASVARRVFQAQRENAQAALLAELDPRLLRDIGLESYRGGRLAERVDAYRRQEKLRQFAARLTFTL